jgi:hydrogenase maturation protease
VSTEANDLLIVGIGSPFGADRAGWSAIDLLRLEREFSGFRMEVADRPGANLLGLLRDVPAAILLDALWCDSPPGTLHRLDPANLALDTRTSNHGFGVADALALGQVLGTLPRRLALLGISAMGSDVPTIDRATLIEMVRSIAQEMGVATA